MASVMRAVSASMGMGSSSSPSQTASNAADREKSHRSPSADLRGKRTTSSERLQNTRGEGTSSRRPSNEEADAEDASSPNGFRGRHSRASSGATTSILLHNTRSTPGSTTHSPAHSPPQTPFYNDSSATSSVTSIVLPRPLLSSPLPHAQSRDSVPEFFNGVGTASSRDKGQEFPFLSPLMNSTPFVEGQPPHTPSTPGGTKGTKIRFAPLPLIRPRAYSTGRNVWLEDADFSEGADGGARGWVRRDQADNQLADMSLDNENAIGSDDESGSDHAGAWVRRPTSQEGDAAQAKGGIRGSSRDGRADLERTISAGSMLSSNASAGGSSINERGRGRAPREEAESYASKLLRPLSFGLVGKKKRSSTVESSTRSDSLSRTSSRESEASTSHQPHQHVGTGIPMRKTRTWEPDTSSDVQHSSRRAMYPPVAQRSRHKPVVKKFVAPTAEPKFIEWGFSKPGGGGGGLGSVRRDTGPTNGIGNNDQDEEDGSGMAWVKRRRAEKEAEKKRKEEEEAAEAEAAAAALVLDSALPEDDGENGDTATPAEMASTSGTTTPMSLSMTLGGATPTNHSVPLPPSSNEPTATLIPTPIPTASSPITHPAIALSPENTAQSITVLPPRALSSEGSDEDEDDDDEEDEEEEDKGANSDSSDLDEDELAEEERLAEQARVTAKGAATEKYHDAQHQAKILKL